MESIFITITGINHYYSKKPFEIGRTVKLIKEPDNPNDNEAIGVYLPFIDKVGNVANSAHTVYGGTYSSGRLWDKIDDYAFAQIMFTTHSSVIALVLPPNPEESTHPTEPQDKNKSQNKIKNEKLTPPTSKTPLSKIGF